MSSEEADLRLADVERLVVEAGEVLVVTLRDPTFEAVRATLRWCEENLPGVKVLVKDESTTLSILDASAQEADDGAAAEA